MDLADDGLGKLTLLALLNLTLVTHPRVKNLLGLSSKGGALLKLVGLSLKLSGFLNETSATEHSLFPVGFIFVLLFYYLPWRPQRAAW